MELGMKKNILIGMMLTLLLLGGSYASAFEATISNPTEHLVFVHGYGVASGTDKSELAMTIGLHPNETLALDFLYYIPSGLTGEILIDNKRLQIRPVTIQGGDATEISQFTPLPEDSSWDICWKAGIIALPIKDNQYGFCKK
jgi:hypothetical protein